MGILKKLFREWLDVKPGYSNLDDISRDHGKITRQYNAEIRRIKADIEVEKLRQQLVNLKKSASGDDDDSGMPDQLLATLLNLAQQKNAQPSTETTDKKESELSDDQISEILSKTPRAVKKKARRMDLPDLIVSIKKEYPDVSDADAERIAEKIKE